MDPEDAIGASGLLPSFCKGSKSCQHMHVMLTQDRVRHSCEFWQFVKQNLIKCVERCVQDWR